MDFASRAAAGHLNSHHDHGLHLPTRSLPPSQVGSCEACQWAPGRRACPAAADTVRAAAAVPALAAPDFWANSCIFLYPRAYISYNLLLLPLIFRHLVKLPYRRSNELFKLALAAAARPQQAVKYFPPALNPKVSLPAAPAADSPKSFGCAWQSNLDKKGKIGR